MTQLPIDQSIPRFTANEDRVDVFVNDPLNVGYYLTNESTPRQVETLPHFMDRLTPIQDANLIGYTASGIGAFEQDLDEKLDEFVSVVNFGAVGDGVADDTLAFQNALNAHRRVFVPPTSFSYIVKKLNAFFDGQELFGAGYRSRIALKAGETGETFNSNGKRVLLKDLYFYGGEESGKGSAGYAEPADGSSGDRSGIYLDFDLDSTLDNLIVSGYARRGIHSINSLGNRHSGTVISNCHVFCCYVGMNAGPNNAEYLRCSNNSYNSCQYGLIVGSGNQTHVGGIISDNYINILVTGTSIANNAHGSIIGALLNHATLYAIQTIDVTNGFSFVGCNLFYGSVYLKNSTGIIISNGIYDLVNLFFEGGGRNYIRNNFCKNSLTNGINHNYNSSTSDTVIVDDFISTGPSTKNSIPIIGKPNFTSGDEEFLRFGEVGTISNYGFTWTSSASTGKMKLFALSNDVKADTPSLEFDRVSGKISAAWCSLSDYADDAAAASGGVPVGGLYRNGSHVMVRVA